jgi:DNA processing protein
MHRGTSTGERPTRGTTDPVERRAWLALSLVPGLGSRRLAALVGRFGSARAALEAPPRAIAATPHVSHTLARGIVGARQEPVDALLDRAAQHGQIVLVPADPAYPARLRSIPDPPPVLFALGDLALLERPAVAIVGSRSHTRYGGDVAARLAGEAARAGVVVVSGMARGLDAVAQRAALEAGGGTIGVLGTGADVVYPAANRALHARVAEVGLLLTEHPPGARPTPGAFPRRNRIISGLATALVVVEAALRSGTLITVECALEQGRDVLAVPGPITSPTSEGTNRLLRDGATPILAAAELPSLLGLVAPSVAPTPALPCTLSPEEARVFDVLGTDPRHSDDIALAVGLPIGTVLGVLLGLELAGLAGQLPGGVFRRIGA